MSNFESPQPPCAPQVAILLCTFHGQQFLSEQLDSYAAQSFQDWAVWISDDGSQDNTQEIINAYRTLWPEDRLHLLNGPCQGFAANFLSLVCHTKVRAAFYAWSDQDDIWETDKLERGVAWLRQQPTATPSIYCSRTRLVDEQNRHIGFSPLFSKPPSFANALTQNIGGGNTMVFNHAARQLLQQAGDATGAISHDWWAYQLITACGGEVLYDSYPSVRYRQHSTNLVGANISLQARFKRIVMLLRGRFRSWNDANLNALWRMQHQITPENQRILTQFDAARRSWLLPRLLGMARSGVYRQTLAGTLALFLGSLIRKI